MSEVKGQNLPIGAIGAGNTNYPTNLRARQMYYRQINPSPDRFGADVQPQTHEPKIPQESAGEIRAEQLENNHKSQTGLDIWADPVGLKSSS